MSLFPHDPFKHLDKIRAEFDQLFSKFPSFEEFYNWHGIKTDVYESDREVIVTCDLPGIEKKEDITIDIENNVLMISGSVNKFTEYEDKRVYRKERQMEGFQRNITLPTAVSHKDVKATYKNGVLEVVIQKKADANRKRIDVDFD